MTWVKVSTEEWGRAVNHWQDVAHLFNNDSFHNFIGDRSYELGFGFYYVKEQGARKVAMLSSRHYKTLVKIYIIRGSTSKKP